MILNSEIREAIVSGENSNKITLLIKDIDGCLNQPMCFHFLEELVHTSGSALHEV